MVRLLFLLYFMRKILYNNMIKLCAQAGSCFCIFFTKNAASLAVNACIVQKITL